MASQDRPEVNASGHVLFKQKSSGNLASFIRASRDSGLFKELKTNPLHQNPDNLSSSPPTSRMEETSSRSFGVSGRHQSALTFSRSVSGGAPPQNVVPKKIPLMPPKAYSSNVVGTREVTPPTEIGSQPSSASSSHSDISAADGESVTTSMHDVSPVTKGNFHMGRDSSPSSNSETQGQDPAPLGRGKPLPPRPQPVGRSPSCSSSEDIRHDHGDSARTSPPHQQQPLSVSVVAEASPTEDTEDDDEESGEEVLVDRGEPPVGDLKFENEVLRHQIMHLKDQRSELELENLVLKEQLTTSSDHSVSDGSPVPSIPNPSSAPARSGVLVPKPIPAKIRVRAIKTSATTSLSNGDVSSVRDCSATPVSVATTPPIPVPRRGSGPVAPAPSVSKPSPHPRSTPTITVAVKQSTTASREEGTPPIKPRRNTTKSASEDDRDIEIDRNVADTAQLSSPPTKPRRSTRASAGEDDRENESGRNVDDTAQQSSPPIKPQRIIKSVTTSIGEDDKEGRSVVGGDSTQQSSPPIKPRRITKPVTTSISEEGETAPEKPSPLLRPIPAPRRCISVPEGTLDESRDKQTSSNHDTWSVEPSSFPDGIAEEVQDREGEGKEVCPAVVSDSLPTKAVEPAAVKPTKPRIAGVTRKKTAIISDESWIRRRKSPSPDESESSERSTGEPAPPRSNVPYRSVPIISTPPPVNPSPLINPGQSYVPRTSRPHVKRTSSPDIPLCGAESRDRAQTQRETISPARMNRSSSDDSLKGSKHVTSRQRATDTKVVAPPKKPPRYRAKRNLDEPNGRPMSMVVGSTSPSTSRRGGKDDSFAVSCTIPRGTQEEAAELMKKQMKKRLKQQRGASDYSKESDAPPFKKSSRGSFFSRGKSKAKPEILAAPVQPALEEEEETESSSSDDEKGGTIRFMPKLRHVSMKKAMSVEDDDEPEYHQLFEYVFVVSLKQVSGSKTLTTEMTYTFPPASGLVFSGKDAALRDIPQFCFPDIDQWRPCTNYRSETFSFVLTDMLGSRRFGYCRRLLPAGRGARLPEVYCIVSPLGCFSLYEKILDQVEERRATSSAEVFTFLKAIVANPFPKPGRSVVVRSFSTKGVGMDVTELRRPMDSRLEHVDFSLLFTTLSPRKIIQLVSSMLLERRIILCAHSLSVLSSCAHALLALIYPFEWQHVFIPVLPNNLIDFVCSPLPYMIGINPACIKQLDSLDMEEALVVDLDKKKFVRKVGDEASILPSKLFQYLEHSLSSSVISTEYLRQASRRPSLSRADEIIINTFMTFFVYLFGNYKQYLKVVDRTTGAAELQVKEFVKSFSSKSVRRYLDASRMTQMFENFREQRENPQKARTVAQGLFEKKIPELRERCQEIEIFSSKPKLKFRVKRGLPKRK